MARLLGRNSSTSLKRKGTVDLSTVRVQSNNKRVCIEGVNNISDTEEEGQDEETANNNNKRTTKKKMSKEEKALLVADQIRARAGLKRELLFRGEGKQSATRSGENGTSEMAVDRVAASVDYKGVVRGPAQHRAWTGQDQSMKVTRQHKPGTGQDQSMKVSTQQESRTGQDQSMKVTRRSEPGTGQDQPCKVLTQQESRTGQDQSRESVSNPFSCAKATLHMQQPRFPSGQVVMGSQVDKRHWKKSNKRRRQQMQMEQPEQSYWTQHHGSFNHNVTFKHPAKKKFRGGMCPSNLALQHPAASLLKHYATEGCPVDTGRRWTQAEVEAAVAYGNHPLEEAAATQFYEEALDKEARGLVELLDWDELSQLHQKPTYD